MTTIQVKTGDDFRFMATVLSHGWYLLAPFKFDKDSRTLHRVHQLDDGQIVKLSMREGNNSIQVDVEGVESLSTQQTAEIRGVVKRIFCVDWQMQDFYSAMRDHADYHWIEANLAGRMLISPTVWEDMAKTLMTTNTTWSQTVAMCGRLGALGDKYSENETAFPSPEKIASMDLDDLNEAIRAGYRGAYLHELAYGIASGQVELESWAESRMTSEDIYKDIKALKGFGDYAAGTMLRLLGRFDRLAIDTAARSAYQRHYNNEVKPSDKEMKIYYEQFGEWQGLAMWMDVMRRHLEGG